MPKRLSARHVVILTLTEPARAYATPADAQRVIARFGYAVKVRAARVGGRYQIRVTCPTGRGDRGAARLHSLASSAWIPARLR